jgi:two-component system response regulator HydG
MKINKHILVVDDDEAVLKSFKALLEMKGYRVSTAKSGNEAVKKACNNFYNLALIDIKLPDVEGTEVLWEFSQINNHMKKIMVTGYASLDNSVESLNLGADGYLIKPVNPGHLLEFVENKLAEQEQEIQYLEEMVEELLESKENEQEDQDRNRWT